MFQRRQRGLRDAVGQRRGRPVGQPGAALFKECGEFSGQALRAFGVVDVDVGHIEPFLLTAFPGQRRVHHEQVVGGDDVVRRDLSEPHRFDGHGAALVAQ